MIPPKTATKLNLPHALSELSRHRRGIVLFSSLISVVLIFLALHFSTLTNSLLLLEIGIIQAGMTVFILQKVLHAFTSYKTEMLRYRLMMTLLSGFSFLLSVGYLFCEISDRYGAPLQIESLQALGIAGTVLLGNFLIIILMHRSRFFRLTLGSIQLSYRTIGKLSLMVVLSTAIIHLTNYYFLDTVLSLILAATLFVWAIFVVLDAYWRIDEVS